MKVWNTQRISHPFRSLISVTRRWRARYCFNVLTPTRGRLSRGTVRTLANRRTKSKANSVFIHNRKLSVCRKESITSHKQRNFKHLETYEGNESNCKHIVAIAQTEQFIIPSNIINVSVLTSDSARRDYLSKSRTFVNT